MLQLVDAKHAGGPVLLKTLHVLIAGRAREGPVLHTPHAKRGPSHRRPFGEYNKVLKGRNWEGPCSRNNCGRLQRSVCRRSRLCCTIVGCPCCHAPRDNDTNNRCAAPVCIVAWHFHPAQRRSTAVPSVHANSNSSNNNNNKTRGLT